MGRDKLSKFSSSFSAGSAALGHTCHASLEPTELEYNNAIREATQELQKSVSDINDILEEAHYLQEDG